MKARDIMTPEPHYVTPGDSITRAARIMREAGVGIVPVVHDSSTMRLEGVLTDRDIAIRCVADDHGGGCRVSDHMTGDRVRTIGPDAEASEVLSAMEMDRVRRIPVVGEEDRLLGIIAQADVATKLGGIAPLEVEHVLERISEPAHAVR